MTFSELDLGDNPKEAAERLSNLTQARDGVRRALFVNGSILIVIMAAMAPFAGSYASALLTQDSLGAILLRREVVNLIGAAFGVGALYLLTRSARINYRQTRNVVLLGLAVSGIEAVVRLTLQPFMGLSISNLGQRWVILEVITASIFAAFLVTVLVLVADRFRLIDAQVILFDEARRALEEDHESLRVRVFDHLHGTVQSELLVTRIRLLDIAREIQNEKLAAAVIKESNNISRIHDLEIRRLAHVMVASGIDTSLSEALRQLALSCEGLCDVKIEIFEDFSEFDETLIGDSRATVRLAIFRIVEECVNNAIRHGHARRIGIRLGAQSRANEHVIYVRVSNDGELPEGQPREGAGLRVLRARASAFNGTVWTTISSGLFVVEAVLEVRD